MNLRSLSIALAVSILLVYGTLLFSAFVFFEPSAFWQTLLQPRTLSAIGFSLSAALTATALAVLISVPAAYALSRYRFFLRPVIDVALELPIVISPAALGALALIFFQTQTGQMLQKTGFDVVYTFYGIVAAQFITVLGICTRLMKAVFDEIPVRYEQIARTMGAKPARAFWDISLPLAARGLLASLILTWAKAVGEFGATITLAGSLPFKTETLPVAIYLRLSTADLQGTVSLIFILLLVSMTTLIIARILLTRKSYD